MAQHTCHNCVYSCPDALAWIRSLWVGEPIVPRCANHPLWPGQLHDVPGVPCRNYRPRPELPKGDVRMIPLGDGYYAYVDAADYEWLNQWAWHKHGGYAARTENHRLVFMHRQIMRPPKGKLVDHMDGNRANNCRRNLRVCNPSENQQNRGKGTGSTSRYKGVFYDRSWNKWRARCRYGGKHHMLGRFDLEVDAARAYDRAAVEHFGDFARLNFPNEWPPQRRLELQAAGEKEGRKVRTQEGRNDAAQRDAAKTEGKKAGTRARKSSSARIPVGPQRPKGKKASRKEGKKPTPSRKPRPAAKARHKTKATTAAGRKKIPLRTPKQQRA